MGTIKIELPDGTKFEGSIEDYKAMKEAELIVSKQPITKTVVVKNFKRRTVDGINRFNKVWAPHEQAILENIWTGRKNKIKLTRKELATAVKLLPGRTRKAVQHEFSKMKKAGKLSTKPRSLITTLMSVSSTNVKTTSTTSRQSFFTPEEEKKFTSCLHLPVKEIADALGKDAHKLQRHINTQGGIRTLRKKYNISAECRMSEKSLTDARIRMKFMSDRASQYLKMYGWSWEKASQQAGDDWRNGRRGLAKTSSVIVVPKKTEIDVEFPKFVYLSKEGNNMLYQIVKNVIGTKGKIGFNDVRMLPRYNDDEWHRPEWIEFIEEFMNRSARIAAHFLSPNKFVMERGANGYEFIIYS
jgi:hypothetical protein